MSSSKLVFSLALFALLLTVAPHRFVSADSTSSNTGKGFLGDSGVDIEKARARMRERMAQKLKWEMATTLEDYERVGKKDSRWDADVREMLNKYAPILTGGISNAVKAMPEVKAACKRAMSAGCNDPLVSYYALQLDNASLSPAERARKFAEAERAMEASSYSEYRKLYASIRAAEHALKASNNGKNPFPEGTDAGASFDRARAHFLNVLKDPAAWRSSITTVEELLFHDIARDNPVGDSHIFKPLATVFESHKEEDGGDPARALLVEGIFWTNYAWEARSSDWASKVSPEKWPQFESALQHAEAVLEEAWKKDQTDPWIPIEMITVEMGQGRGRERMETWFRRAMNTDPDSDIACKHKVLYLEPKWYGSNNGDDVLAFGRQCLATGNWYARLPFILLYAHSELARYEKPDYWKRPEVWADVQKLYTECLAANPNSTSDLTGYAVYAYRAEQWKLANDLFNQLGDHPILDAMKCSREEYDRMRQDAGNKAGNQ